MLMDQTFCNKNLMKTNYQKKNTAIFYIQVQIAEKLHFATIGK